MAPAPVSISARSFGSATCEPSRFALGPTTASVQLDACASSPIYLSIFELIMCLDLALQVVDDVGDYLEREVRRKLETVPGSPP